MNRTISATWMRGGTSKCWVFEREQLEVPGMSVDDVLLRLYGSPDPRQVDGVGGATSTTSKAVILSRASDDEADVDYTFAQVGIGEATVDWGSNCGNCSAVVAPFALARGWVAPAADETIVRVRNTNTGQVIWERLATPGARWEERLDTDIPGVPFSGTAVGLGFVNPAGRTTGRLLPTGRVRDTLQVEEGQVEASLVDAGAPLVIVSAETAALSGARYADWASLGREALARLDAIRRAGAVAMGLAPSPAEAERAVPKLAIVSTPGADSDADLDVLMLSMGLPHPALPVTGSVGLTMAAAVPGGIVADAVRGSASDGIRLRTPAGTISTWRRTIDGEDVVGTVRTSRVLAHAQLPLPSDAPVGA